MTSYDIFGKFYDAVMGDRAEATEQLRALIRKASPNARTVLELACGTGSVLKRLSKYYAVWGVDLSKRMLAIARKKVPRAKLSRQNMVTFRLRQRFDVICCVFDSINHVMRFADWERLFSNVHRHLSEGGAFIFDINTQKKLERLIAEPAWVHKFGNNFLIMKVTGRSKLSNWNIKVFARTRGIATFYTKKIFRRRRSRCRRSFGPYEIILQVWRSSTPIESSPHPHRRGCTSSARNEAMFQRPGQFPDAARWALQWRTASRVRRLCSMSHWGVQDADDPTASLVLLIHRARASRTLCSS